MDRKAFQQELIRLAKSLGCAQAEAYFGAGESFSVNVSDGAFDRYEVSGVSGIGLRVTVNGRDGYVYTEAFDDPETMVKKAIDNAGIIEDSDVCPMQTKQAYEPVPARVSPLSGRGEAEKIDLCLSLEKAVRQADSRVERLLYCEAGDGAGVVEIVNTLGLFASRSTKQSYLYAMPALVENGETRTGFAFRTGADVFDIEGLAMEAVRDAAEKFGASPAPSGTYRVVIKNRAMGNLLSAFAPMFSAEEAQKGRSLLAGREGTCIADSRVSIIDDPFHTISPRAFDGEGTPCKTKRLVDCGVLTTLLHNLKTAKKAGIHDAGNARRASAASPVGVGISVCYIEPGETVFEDLITELDRGLVITDLEGLHAGLSCVSGDFSLKAEGYLVENGVRTRPVTEITVAGNFLTLLAGIRCVGADLIFGLPGGAMAGAPSVLVDALAVAGK